MASGKKMARCGQQIIDKVGQKVGQCHHCSTDRHQWSNPLAEQHWHWCCRNQWSLARSMASGGKTMAKKAKVGSTKEKHGGIRGMT